MRDYRDYRASSRETDRSHITSSRGYHRNSHLESSNDDKGINDYYHNSHSYTRERERDRSRDGDVDRNVDSLETSRHYSSSREYDRDARLRNDTHRESRNHVHHTNSSHSLHQNNHRVSNNHRAIDRLDDRRSTDDHRSDSRSRSDDDESDLDRMSTSHDASTKCNNVITDVTNVIAPSATIKTTTTASSTVPATATTTTNTTASSVTVAGSPGTVITNENGTSRSLSPSQLTVENLDSIINSLSSLTGLPDLRKLPPEEAMETIRKVLDLMKKATSSEDADGKIGYNFIGNSLNCNLNNTTPGMSGTTGKSSMDINGSSSHNCKRSMLNGNLNNSEHPYHHVYSTSTVSNTSNNGKINSLNNKLPDMSESSVSGPTKLSSTTGISASNNASKLNGLISLNGVSGLGIPSPSSVISDYSLPGSPSDSGVDIQAPSSKHLVPSTLAPSLVNCFREDLIKHVQGWPADAAEKQV